MLCDLLVLKGGPFKNLSNLLINDSALVTVFYVFARSVHYCLYDAETASMRCTTVAQRHRSDVIVTSSRPLRAPAAVARRPGSLADLDYSMAGYRLTSSAASWPRRGLVIALCCLVLVTARFTPITDMQHV